MPQSPDSTLPSWPIPTVVLIGPAKAVVDACARLIHGLEDAPRIEVTDVKSAATVVARWRPFAVIVAGDVFAFDPDEFHALARDVGAELMSVDADATGDDVATLLLPRLKAALGRWRDQEGKTKST